MGNHVHLLLRPEAAHGNRWHIVPDTFPWLEVTSGVSLPPLFLRWRIRAGTRASRCLGLVDAEMREIACAPPKILILPIPRKIYLARRNMTRHNPSYDSPWSPYAEDPSARRPH
jgi:hypothetical protein